MRMKTLAKVRERLEQRPAELEEARKKGQKIVGYFCCNVPEEVIYAAGLIPLRLGRGGDDRLVEIGGRYLSAQTCAFVRESVGMFATGEDPYAKNIDYLAVAANCLQIYRLAEVVDHYFKIKTLVIGVPRNYYQEQGVSYFEEVIEEFAGQLEEIVGTQIEASRLAEAIALFQGIRLTVQKIYGLLSRPDASVSWREVYELVQAGFFLDRDEYLSLLTEFLAEAEQDAAATKKPRKPRLLLSGSLIPTGDEKLLNIIDEVGGEVIVDDLCTGLRPFLELNVKHQSVRGIARAYLERVPCASLPQMDIEGDRRLQTLAKLVKTYQPDGVIYHTLRYCDPFTFKANETKKFLGPDIPFLEIHTEYATSDTEGIRTRVGAFVELLKSLKSDEEVG